MRARTLVLPLVLLIMLSAGALALFTGPPSGSVRWSTGAENGYPGEWSHDPEAWDSGDPIDGYTVQSSEQVHSGKYSFKQVMTNGGDSGTRLPRIKEPSTYEDLYYSAWFYIPREPSSWTTFNFIQWKGKYDPDGGSEVVWALYYSPERAPFQLHLADKSRRYNGVDEKHYYQKNPVTIPVGRWFHLEMRYKIDHEPAQSVSHDGGNTGRITVWQDGAQIFDVQNVVTAWTYQGGDGGYGQPWRLYWTINAYGTDVVPGDYFHYLDDVAIGTARLGE